MSEWLKEIFLYSQGSPLIFTRFYFWVFFALVMLGYSFVYRKENKSKRALYLFVVSTFFYYKSSGLFFSILLFSTVFDFYIGNAVYYAKTAFRKKAFISISIFVNLSILVYFKYAYFFTESYNQIFHTSYEAFNVLAYWSNSFTGSHFDVSKILLPVGISFFTFQTISYSIDIYRKEVEPVKNLIDFGFFVTFFPQLVAGPIVRASQFIPQIYREYKLSKEEFGIALFWILKGLVKKIFIGDYIAVNFIDRIFINPLHYSGFENLMAMFGYSLQVYVDFSGYTDIAIGVALLLGFTLPQNFNSPYKAKNVSDFWKRWHISLSSWLKDYLYIPMGGNKKGSFFSFISLSVMLAFIVLLSGIWWLSLVFAGTIAIGFALMKIFPSIKGAVNTNINLLLTMLIGGLWHGASYNFIIWGALNGIGLVFYKFWRKISPWEQKNNRLSVVWKIAITFSFITFTRAFFRAKTFDDAMAVLSQTFTKMDLTLIPDILIGYKYVFIVMAIGFIFHWLPYRTKEMYEKWFVGTPIWAKVLITACVVFIIYQSVSSEMVPFIYFQF